MRKQRWATSSPSRTRGRHTTSRSSNVARTRAELICYGTHDPMRPITGYVRVIDLAAPTSRHTGTTMNFGAGWLDDDHAGHVLPAGNGPASGRLAAVGPVARAVHHAVGLLERRGREQRNREPQERGRQELHDALLEPEGESAVRQELYRQRLRQRRQHRRARRNVGWREHHGRHAVVATYSDWRDFGGGAMVPTHIEQTRGGWPFFEVNVTNARGNPADASHRSHRPPQTPRRSGRPAGRRTAAGADRHDREARRRSLPAHDGPRQLRLACSSSSRRYVMMLEAGQSIARAARRTSPRRRSCSRASRSAT